ncbi:MAG TPA: D-tyrosyl-tRNA(Tyr) deacylase [Opitutae bacterium]|nr:D-tyrosyl-tRNA(Tyr) deacylase [Opitutaceae bacterium]HCR28582.1 D-tyrosyl-tRNA(Tyr) deacylase [Opitutae bacterium]
MRAVAQRVTNASVSIGGVEEASIEKGLLVLLGIHKRDTGDDVDWVARKIGQLRVFEDENGLMNQSLSAFGGEILLVSQFTLIASVRKGNRPSFNDAANADFGERLVQEVASTLSQYIEKPVKTGVFGANMQVSLTNDGPVTILFDSHARA